MSDARLLREITDALRALTDKADRAGSKTVRSILIMTADAVHREADKAARAEREAGPRPPDRT